MRGASGEQGTRPLVAEVKFGERRGGETACHPEAHQAERVTRDAQQGLCIRGVDEGFPVVDQRAEKVAPGFAVRATELRDGGFDVALKA